MQIKAVGPLRVVYSLLNQRQILRSFHQPLPRLISPTPLTYAPYPMKNPRIPTALAVAGLALAAAFITATLVRAAEGPSDTMGPVVLPAEVLALPMEQAILTSPPHVPAPIKRKYAARVVVNLEVREVVKRLADGVAKSDYLMADKERSIRGIIKGQSGEMTVNGVKYNGVMPPVMLTDEQIAHVLTFVRNTWGNTGDMVTVEEVQRVHAESVKQ